MESEKLLLKALLKIDQLEETISDLSQRIDNLEKHIKSNINTKLVSNNDALPNLEIAKKLSAADCTNNEIRKIIWDLASRNLIDNEMLENFQNDEWCKTNFKLSYPLLRRVELGRYDHLGHPRYWNEALKINGTNYYVTHEWYTHRRKLFLQWYNKLNNTIYN